MLLGFYLSYDISSRFWIWDREWHTPFTAALRVQRMPFRNVYEPDLTLRYHMAGDVFAALLQSLSFARMNASRALSVAHDMQSALLVGSIAMIFRARTPWSPIVAALAAAVPFLVGPMGYYYGAMGTYQGFADFSNFTLSFRPHCMLSLLMLVGFVACVIGFAERTNQAPSPRPRPTLLGLLPLFGLSAITDEMSTALVGVTLAVLWLWRPNLMAPRRWQGAVVAGARWRRPRWRRTCCCRGRSARAVRCRTRTGSRRASRTSSARPLALGFSREGWQQLLIDEAPLLFPAAVAVGLVLSRRDGPRAVERAALVRAAGCCCSGWCCSSASR